MKNYQTYQPSADCKKCGGECCKTMGCHYSPRDFKSLTFEALKFEISKGRISIDWWEDPSGPQYYLRARNIGEPIVCGSWGGVCVNLTPTGCALSWEERPLGGRALKPTYYRRKCIGSYSKEDCKNEWQEYAGLLELLVEYFR